MTREGIQVKDYVVQSGPLRTFDVLYDNRFEKLRPVGDYHTVSITGKPTTQRIHMNAMSRSADREVEFISSLFSALAGGAHAIFGLRDITGGKAGELSKKLTVHAHAFSKTARERIEAAGGTVQIIE